MQSVDKNIQWYQSKFQAFEQSLNGEKSTVWHTLRRHAIHQFEQIGFPTTRQEEWRFTNVSPIVHNEFQPILNYEANGISKESVRKYILPDSTPIIFINGMFSHELSETGDVPEGMIVGSLQQALKNHSEQIRPYLSSMSRGEENAFTALNMAFLLDGACICIPEKVYYDRPIQIIFIATDAAIKYAAQPRNLIVAGKGSHTKIIESYIGISQNSYLTNSVTEIILENDAHLEHDKIQIESTDAFHVGTTFLRMDSRSRYESNAISLGGALVRNTITTVLDGEHSECTLNGLSLAGGYQVIDNHTAIDHAKPHCNSHELYKAILGGASKGIFNGKIFVRKDAQKTDAKQTNKTLLLSDDATINAKPQLEIFADDVKCTHGATIGQLDEEQVFYLRTRGIDLETARNMLTTAFANDVIQRISLEPLREQVTNFIHTKLRSLQS